MNFIGKRMAAESMTYFKLKPQEFGFKKKTPINLYLKKADGKLELTYKKGSVVDITELTNQTTQEAVPYLYSKANERIIYIRQASYFLEENLHQRKLSVEKKFSYVRSLISILIQEIKANGLDASLVRDISYISTSIYGLINTHYNEMNKITISPQAETEFEDVFLVTILSGAICKYMGWDNQRTIETVLMGAILHDIGKYYVPEHLLEQYQGNTSQTIDLDVKKHPRLGADILDEFSEVSEAVKQIVLQHHECNDGSGYPMGLNAFKIYPLAKIVAFANEYSEVVSDQRVKLKDGFKLFLQNKETVFKYDSSTIKAMVKCLKGEVLNKATGSNL
ncbi:MAG: hypothetical protein CME62_14700 [Halobacteriovoraceae bacterium]|nr:hypothetical protein [Halobacteriovoraceae bacterium]|tara:strand:+ start:8232 stop:9236 length:1005 start_codon:yes stop_codon:yes gene_type:complete